MYDCVWVSSSDLIIKVLLLKIFKPDPTSICVVEKKQICLKEYPEILGNTIIDSLGRFR